MNASRRTVGLSGLLLALCLTACTATEPSSPPPAAAAACSEGQTRCVDRTRIARCEKGVLSPAEACPLVRHCEAPTPQAAACVPPRLDSPDFTPLTQASLTPAQLDALEPDADSAIAALIGRIHDHYREADIRQAPAFVAPAARVGLEGLQRTALARRLMGRILAACFEALKDTADFAGLARTPVIITETAGLSYHFLYSTDQAGDVPGVRLEVLLSENPNAGVGVARRLVQVFGHDADLYLSIGFLDREQWGEENLAHEIRKAGEQFGAVLAHVFWRENYPELTALCEDPRYPLWRRDTLNLSDLPQDWTACGPACREGLAALQTALAGPLPEAVAVPADTPPAAALCAGLLSVFGAPPGMTGLAPDRQLSAQAVVGLWRAVLGEAGLARLLVRFAAHPDPRHAELLLALRDLPVSVVRGEAEALVRRGPTPQALALIPVWAGMDQRHAATVLEDLYPRYRRDPEAARVLVDALGHNPAADNVPFLLERIADGGITRKALYALLNIDPHRPRALASVLEYGPRFDSEQALAVMEFMMAMQPKTRGPLPVELLPLVRDWQTRTADFRVYQLGREVLDAYSQPDWARPRRSPRLSSYLNQLDADPGDAQTRQELLVELAGADPAMRIELMGYLHRLREQARVRALDLLAALAREQPAWREELTRLSRLHDSPHLAGFAREALAAR